MSLIKTGIRTHIVLVIMMSLLLLQIFITHTNASDQGIISVTNNRMRINQSPTYDTSIPYVVDSKVVIDGSIDPNEYSQSYEDRTTDMKVYWEYTDDNMTLGLTSIGTGWLAIGFGPSMSDSNIIMGGMFDNSTAYCYDLTGITGFQHQDDIDGGGTDDIINCAASESGGSTTLELVVEFNPNDPHEQLQSGDTIKFFFAFHIDSDVKTEKHSAYSQKKTLYFKPSTASVETFLVITSPEEVAAESEFSIMVTVYNNATNETIPNLDVSLSRLSQFGGLNIGKTATGDNGTGIFNMTSTNLSGDTIFTVKANELIRDEGGILTSYLSSEVDFMVHIDAEPKVEEPQYVILSRWGIVAAFWIAGFVIWSAFGYNIYAAIQIYRNRDKEELKRLESGSNQTVQQDRTSAQESEK